MKVIIHEGPCIDRHGACPAQRGDTAEEIFPVLLCPEDLCLRETSADDMVEGTGGIKACAAGHTQHYAEDSPVSRISSL